MILRPFYQNIDDTAGAPSLPAVPETPPGALNLSSASDKIAHLNFEEPPPAMRRKSADSGADTPATPVPPEESESADSNIADQAVQESVDDDQDGQDESIKTLDDLATALGVDRSVIDSLTDTFGEGDDATAVSIADQKTRYQSQQQFDEQLANLQAQQAVNQQAAQAQAQAHEQALAQVGLFLQNGRQMLLNEVNSPDMQALRTTDPAAYIARQEEINARANALSNLFSHAEQQLREYNTRQQTQRHADIQWAQQQETVKLIRAIPNWDQAKTDIAAYLTTDYAFADDELNSIYDSRHFIIAHKAMLYDQAQKVSKQTSKTVQDTPPMAKPGKAKTGFSKQRSKINAARARFKKSGSLDDASTLIGLTKGI